MSLGFFRSRYGGLSCTRGAGRIDDAEDAIGGGGVGNSSWSLGQCDDDATPHYVVSTK
jgi:hypothetical protein